MRDGYGVPVQPKRAAHGDTPSPSLHYPFSQLRGLEARGRIVLIEDDPDIQEVISYSLTQAGFSVRIAGSAKNGLDAACRGADLVLLDLNLPDGDGLEICRHLRRRSASSSTPILIISARSDAADKDRGREAGATDYLVKPFSLKELVSRCRTHVRRA